MEKFDSKMFVLRGFALYFVVARSILFWSLAFCLAVLYADFKSLPYPQAVGEAFTLAALIHLAGYPAVFLERRWEKKLANKYPEVFSPEALNKLYRLLKLQIFLGAIGIFYVTLYLIASSAPRGA